MTDYLVAFLEARLDEDQDAALREQAMRAGYKPDEDVVGTVVVFPFDEIGSPGDPARVLVEVAAKRRIVTEHEAVLVAPGRTDTTCAGCGGSYNQRPCATLALLALPYASHPGYQEGWKP